MKHEISDEQLNAFIDDELDAADREGVLAAVAVDGELAQRTCALRLAQGTGAPRLRRTARGAVAAASGPPVARVGHGA